MNMTPYRSNSFRNALVATALVFGFGIAHGANDDAAAPQPHSDSLGAAATDTAITARVKAKITSEAALENSHISVTTTNGVVTLGGSASSSSAKSVATAAARSVEGVTSVDNQLKTPTTTKTSAATHDTLAKTEEVGSDSWITTKVKSGILASSLTQGFDVNVKTTHGVVVLRGALANQAAVDNVKDIAGKVEGVKSVNASALKVAS
jgi:hyperosmotically inducible protein